MVVQCNLAAAQTKINAFDVALKTIDTVIRCQPNNVKALYRKGKIVDALGDTNEAIALFQKAATLDPENKSFQNELSKLILKRSREQRNEKNLYQKMLGQAQKMEQKPVKAATKTAEAPLKVFACFRSVFCILHLIFSFSVETLELPARIDSDRCCWCGVLSIQVLRRDGGSISI